MDIFPQNFKYPFLFPSFIASSPPFIVSRMRFHPPFHACISSLLSLLRKSPLPSHSPRDSRAMSFSDLPSGGGLQYFLLFEFSHEVESEEGFGRGYETLGQMAGLSTIDEVSYVFAGQNARNFIVGASQETFPYALHLRFSSMDAEVANNIILVFEKALKKDIFKRKTSFFFMAAQEMTIHPYQGISCAYACSKPGTT